MDTIDTHMRRPAAPQDASEAEAALADWLQATGELVALGLNALPRKQAQLIDKALSAGGRVALAATLDPVCVRGVLEVPGGEPVVIFEVHGASSPTLN